MKSDDTVNPLVPVTGPPLAVDRQMERMAPTAQCPWCGEGRSLEHVGGVWNCFVCSRTWV